MELVPVIDLLGGRVVRAQRGERSRYQPLHSPLCGSSEPLAVARAFLELYPFKSLYIADLDAIQHFGDNLDTLIMLRERLPQIEFWLDAGMQQPEQVENAMSRGFKCVIGSEGLLTLAQYQALTAARQTDDTLLSLDFNSQGFMGPSALLQQPQHWPQTLICMTLGKVGSLEGPDFDRLAAIAEAADGRRLYAAGGIRDVRDIQRLQSSGVSGALLASALHLGKINAAQLAQLQA